MLTWLPEYIPKSVLAVILAGVLALLALASLALASGVEAMQPAASPAPAPKAGTWTIGNPGTAPKAAPGYWVYEGWLPSTPPAGPSRRA